MRLTYGSRRASLDLIASANGHRQIEIKTVTTWSDTADFPKPLKNHFSDMKVRA